MCLLPSLQWIALCLYLAQTSAVASSGSGFNRPVGVLYMDLKTARATSGLLPACLPQPYGEITVACFVWGEKETFQVGFEPSSSTTVPPLLTLKTCPTAAKRQQRI